MAILLKTEENLCISSIRPQKDHRNPNSYLGHSRIPQMSIFISGQRLCSCWGLLSSHCAALARVPAMWSAICLLLIEVPPQSPALSSTHALPPHELALVHSPCSAEPDCLCWANFWPAALYLVTFGAPVPGEFLELTGLCWRSQWNGNLKNHAKGCTEA